MNRLLASVLVLLFVVFGMCVASVAQLTAVGQLASPRDVTVLILSGRSRDYDGQLVRLRARLTFGWEEDNFLEPPEPPTTKGNSKAAKPPRIWFYWNADNHRVSTLLEQAMSTQTGTGRMATAVVIGYFHFVSDKKATKKDVFDAGPLQLEITAVFGIDTPQPAVSTEKSPH